MLYICLGRILGMRFVLIIQSQIKTWNLSLMMWLHSTVNYGLSRTMVQHWQTYGTLCQHTSLFWHCPVLIYPQQYILSHSSRLSSSLIKLLTKKYQKKKKVNPQPGYKPRYIVCFFEQCHASSLSLNIFVIFFLQVWLWSWIWGKLLAHALLQG